MLVAGCAAHGPRKSSLYTVQRGDTLYSIAWRHSLDYLDVARWNHLHSDYRLQVGQVLTLQSDGTRTAPAAPVHRSNPAAPQPGAARAVPPAAAPPPHAASPPPPAKAPSLPAGAEKWTWPTDRHGAPRPVPGGGILLLGTLGQDVRATASGRVVYTGNGLRGYGNLIIIKHGETLLSSYAHNQEMLVHEGQEVLGGQVIAHMGTGPHQIAALYFEIRVNGRPVDPATYEREIK